MKESKERMGEVEKEVSAFLVLCIVFFGFQFFFASFGDGFLISSSCVCSLTFSMCVSLQTSNIRQMEDERTKMRQNEAGHKEMSLNWLKERDDLKKQLSDLRSKTEGLDATLVTKEKKIKELVTNVS